ncbi:MAG: histidine kinase [Bacteroidota bacterium]
MKKLVYILYLQLVCLLQVNTSFAQNTNTSNYPKYKGSNLNKKSDELEKTLSENSNNELIGTKYYELSEALYNENNLVKAEEYIKKAIDALEESKSKKKLKTAFRLQAKIKEGLNKKNEAIASYESASDKQFQSNEEDINQLDAKRLKSNNSASSNKLIESKIKTIQNSGGSNKSNNQDEIAQSYKQLALNNVQANEKTTAIENYSNAVQTSSNNPELNKQLVNELANLLEKEKDFDKAIEVRNNAIKTAELTGDGKNLIEQKQGIAKILINTNQSELAEGLLTEAHRFALKNNHALEARNTTLQLMEFYKQHQQEDKAIQTGTNYLNELERLIKNDSSLIDKSLFELSDAKIKSLEKEKQLKDELISEKNSFNIILIISLFIAMLLSIVIVRYAYIVNQRNKKISLQSLRREMNPHFIFNSLNSVNQFIAQNNELEANKFLSSYSTLMRNVMDNSSKDFLPLSKEIEQLEKYLQLEHLRFKDKFDYEINVSETLDNEQLLVPNMLLQPHIENAIWHGLRYKTEKGKIWINVVETDNQIEIVIKDDGIGIEKSKAIKTNNQKLHQSIGLKNIDERIKLLNELYKFKIVHLVNSNDQGTCVTFKFPKINKV